MQNMTFECCPYILAEEIFLSPLTFNLPSCVSSIPISQSSTSPRTYSVGLASRPASEVPSHSPPCLKANSLIYRMSHQGMHDHVKSRYVRIYTWCPANQGQSLVKFVGAFANRYSGRPHRLKLATKIGGDSSAFACRCMQCQPRPIFIPSSNRSPWHL